jgi:hypothetical protein
MHGVDGAVAGPAPPIQVEERAGIGLAPGQALERLQFTSYMVTVFAH